MYATKQQTKALSKLTYIEIDMAFKRIHGITNEWEVSAYLPRVQKGKIKILFMFIYLKLFRYLYTVIYIHYSFNFCSNIYKC